MRFESATQVSAHSPLPCFIIYFVIFVFEYCGLWNAIYGFLEAWFDGSVHSESIYFISLRNVRLLPTWHHFELNSQLAGGGNKQIVNSGWNLFENWILVIDSTGDIFSLHSQLRQLNWLSCRVYLFIFLFLVNFHCMYSTYEDLKTNFVLCMNPGFISTPLHIFQCDSRYQLLLQSSQGWLWLDLLQSSLTRCWARFSSS